MGASISAQSELAIIQELKAEYASSNTAEKSDDEQGAVWDTLLVKYQNAAKKVLEDQATTKPSLAKGKTA